MFYFLPFVVAINCFYENINQFITFSILHNLQLIGTKSRSLDPCKHDKQ